MADRRELLRELASIEAAVATLEEQFGPRAGFSDVRRQCHAMRTAVYEQAGVLEQLRGRPWCALSGIPHGVMH